MTGTEDERRRSEAGVRGRGGAEEGSDEDEETMNGGCEVAAERDS